MTHPLFRHDVFIKTPFACRFQAMIRLTWHKRSWHGIVADDKRKTNTPNTAERWAIRETILSIVAGENT